MLFKSKERKTTNEIFDKLGQLHLKVGIIEKDIDIINARLRSKILKKSKPSPQEEEGSDFPDDGFDELRKLNKPANS